MIQSGTFLNIIDNSGAKQACCIQVSKGFRRRYAYAGDVVNVSIKSLRSKRRSVSKAKKGEIFRALIVHTKHTKKLFNSECLNFFENSAVLLNRQNKFIGTRIFGSIPKHFRKTKFFKLITLSSGIIN
jgi:large subunit ribosomal protein L14